MSGISRLLSAAIIAAPVGFALAVTWWVGLGVPVAFAIPGTNPRIEAGEVLVIEPRTQQVVWSANGVIAVTVRAQTMRPLDDAVDYGLRIRDTYGRIVREARAQIGTAWDGQSPIPGPAEHVVFRFDGLADVEGHSGSLELLPLEPTSDRIGFGFTLEDELPDRASTTSSDPVDHGLDLTYEAYAVGSSARVILFFVSRYWAISLPLLAALGLSVAAWVRWQFVKSPSRVGIALAAFALALLSIPIVLPTVPEEVSGQLPGPGAGEGALILGAFVGLIIALRSVDSSVARTPSIRLPHFTRTTAVAVAIALIVGLTVTLASARASPFEGLVSGVLFGVLTSWLLDSTTPENAGGRK